ncbi:integrin alpha-L [Spea bombifrons]|uniref:integrin alpha-L n=1 Tax=Spea bombifrons TaxID=233779 RepID=UPI00234A355C|nr:integrin alpha-L [Spea bombifrons]
MRLFSHCLLLALSIFLGLDVSFGFNLAVSAEGSFSVPSSGLFGYRVRQFNSTEGLRVIVGDPGSGQVHICEVTSGRCDVILPPYQSEYFGLTLEVDRSARESVVCGLALPHDCNRVLYMNGVCYKLNSSLSVSEEITPGYRDCQKAEVDLCFLIDGSQGMGEEEIATILDFMKSTIRSLNSSTVNFAAVQFSTIQKTEFDFLKFQMNRDPDLLLRTFQKMNGVTNLFKAIQYTFDNVFVPAAGSRPHAKKVLLMLTDGDTTERESDHDLQEFEKTKVIRYIVGIGNNFQTSETKRFVELLASEPSAEHIWYIRDVSELKGLFSEIERKIASIEDTASSSTFPREFSSAGLSADALQGSLVLGDPGVHQWSGGVLEVFSTQDTLINTSLAEDRHFAYLGYSVRLIQTPEGLFCVAGAPRHEYRGAAVLLRKRSDAPGWKEIQTLYGEQVGSYFGSEIAVSDINKDGRLHLVLVSAPHYIKKRWGGQVSVCLFAEGDLSCSAVLHGQPGHPFAQFGASVSSISDLDGDAVDDVAVGAPYELDGRGALYIFKGEAGGVQPTYSQRLVGSAGSHGFGLSVHGVLDVTEDGLTDVAVGSWGQVTIHRSRPILLVVGSITFQPQEIPLYEVTGCDMEVSAKACVTATILTPNYAGPLDVSLQYSLALDVERSFTRILFENKRGVMNETVTIRREGETCQPLSVHLSDCSMEDVSPVLVSLSMRRAESSSQWLFSPSSNLTAVSVISFQICENGGICGSDVSVGLRGESTLVVREASQHSVSMDLRDKGEVGHPITVTITYPTGLSFHKATLQILRRIPLSCSKMEQQKTVCNVSHAMLRRGRPAVMDVVFDIDPRAPWPQMVDIDVEATSENETDETLSDNRARQQVRVLHPISVVVKGMDKSTKYTNFSNQDQLHVLTHSYQIKNVDPAVSPVEVTVAVMTERPQPELLAWDVQSVRGELHVICDPVRRDHVSRKQAATHQGFLCRLGNLTEAVIHVSGKLRPTRTWKEPLSIDVKTSVQVRYDQGRYHSDTGDQFHKAQVITHVELLVPPNHLLPIIGGCVGGGVFLLIFCGLLYKCGFFTRYKDRMQKAAQGPAEGDGTQGPEETELQERLSQLE